MTQTANITESETLASETADDTDSYSQDDVLQHFSALLSSLDFYHILNEIGLSGFKPLKRKKATMELSAMSIALWKLALERSFPNDANAFFEEFIASSPVLNGSKSKDKLRQRSIIYVDLFGPKKDTDFVPVAKYLIDTMILKTEDQKGLELKISLLIRNVYNTIFKKLI